MRAKCKKYFGYWRWLKAFGVGVLIPPGTEVPNSNMYNGESVVLEKFVQHSPMFNGTGKAQEY